MIKATKIKMHDGYEKSNSVLEIKEIYLVGVKRDGFYSKESVHNFIVKNPSMDIRVDIYPYPKLIAATRDNKKYVRSEANLSTNDNLLKLSRL